MIFAIVAAVILIADQWLKYWVTVNITLATGSHELLPGVVKLVNIHNSGAAFGLLDNVSYARWIFLAITAAFVVIIVLLLVKHVFDSRFAVWCEVLFLTGALGNCIDRVFLGYVVDMFKLDFVNFAVFNIADTVLVVSCLMFVLYVFFGSRTIEEDDEEPETPSASAAASDDFADIFGIDTAAMQPDKPERLTPAEPKKPARDDDFWRDLAPAGRSSAVRPAEKPASKPAGKKPEQVEYDLEDILAEFRDL